MLLNDLLKEAETEELAALEIDKDSKEFKELREVAESFSKEKRTSPDDDYMSVEMFDRDVGFKKIVGDYVFKISFTARKRAVGHLQIFILNLKNNKFFELYRDGDKLVSPASVAERLGHLEGGADVDIDVQLLEINSLEGCPETARYFSCSRNPLTSFEHTPKNVKSFSAVEMPNITSLKGFDKIVKKAESVYFNKTPLVSNVLCLLNIEGLQEITIAWGKGSPDLFKAQAILRDALKNGKDIFDCQEQMLDAGLEDFAKL